MYFVHSDQIFAEVKEDLSSYFATGALDDLMFPIWTEYCLKRLRKGTLVKSEQIVRITNGRGELPDDFDSVRSARICEINHKSIMSPVTHYRSIDTRLTPIDPCECPSKLECSCNPCKPDSEYQVTYKTNSEVLFTFKTGRVLHPGKVAKDSMSDDCFYVPPSCHYKYDISGCHIYTDAPTDSLFLEYYAKYRDEDGNPMIPDNIYIQSYIKDYIKYKLFEKLLNMTTDESFSQVNYKYQLAEKKMKESYVHCDIELKKQTKAQINRSIQRTDRRFRRIESRYR